MASVYPAGRVDLARQSPEHLRHQPDQHQQPWQTDTNRHR